MCNQEKEPKSGRKYEKLIFKKIVKIDLYTPLALCFSSYLYCNDKKNVIATKIIQI